MVSAARQYGIPVEILVGLIQSEITFDTDINDQRMDTVLSHIPQASELLDRVRSGIGPGVGNMHLSTLREVAKYFEDNYPDRNDMSLGVSDGESRTSLTRRLLDDEFSVQAIAAMVRMLADYRFGSDGNPSLRSHADINQWTLQDGLAMWHGYRYGVDGVTPGGIGFTSIARFQDRDGMAYRSFLHSVNGPSAALNVTQTIQYFTPLME
ncbi:MAG TPA: hypothetical protein PLD25_32720 [Chloroflexota bacterium]|nr:hypothetical protein [Chloroflexota bacterium]HUM70192.1 hypothetical protein [Chloroflexota bacterium]